MINIPIYVVPILVNGSDNNVETILCIFSNGVTSNNILSANAVTITNVPGINAENDFEIEGKSALILELK